MVSSCTKNDFAGGSRTATRQCRARRLANVAAGAECLDDIADKSGNDMARVRPEAVSPVLTKSIGVAPSGNSSLIATTIGEEADAGESEDRRRGNWTWKVSD